MGGNRYISKVRVFKSEKPGSLPYFLFYVEEPQPEAKPDTRAEVSKSANETRNGRVESRLVKKSVDEKSVVRHHVFRAKL